MQKAEKRFNAIFKKLKNSDIRNESLMSLDIVKLICETNKSTKYKWRVAYISVALSILLLALYASLSTTSKCILELPFEASKIFREPEYCDICINVTEVDRVSNISRYDFDRLYVAKAKPVVITDGTKGWSAMNTFTFEFFKRLYESVSEDDDPNGKCQFFPYKTEFKSLAEVFSMSPERSRLAPGTTPWYIGWSNCNDEAGKVLRRHYSKPYFLPEISENIALNWMFMGGPGSGAHMHVDNVVHPSWQAQLSGRKTWILAPPPECFYKCKQFQVTVEPGEIIVVDTNRWYHQTNILPGSISITIGAEFD